MASLRGQIVSPDRTVLIGLENAKIRKFKCDILSEQKLIEKAKNVPFWRVFEKLFAVKQCYHTGQIYKDKKWWKMSKLKMGHVE